MGLLLFFWIYIASVIMVDLQSPITCCNLSKVTKKILWNWALFKRKTWIPLNLIDKIELYCRIFYDNICKCLIFWTHSLSGVTHTATMSKYTLLESCSKSLSCNVLTFQFVQERAKLSFDIKQICCKKYFNRCEPLVVYIPISHAAYTYFVWDGTYKDCLVAKQYRFIQFNKMFSSQ